MEVLNRQVYKDEELNAYFKLFIHECGLLKFKWIYRMESDTTETIIFGPNDLTECELIKDWYSVMRISQNIWIIAYYKLVKYRVEQEVKKQMAL